MRSLYGKVFPEVFRTDRATKARVLCDKNRRQYFPVQTEQTRLIRDLLYSFVGSQFVLTLWKRPKNTFSWLFFVVVLFSVIFAIETSHLGHLFLQDSKTHSVCSSSSLYGAISFSFLENIISTMFSRAGKLIYLRGKDEFFQTGNEPNGVGLLSQPYNKDLYIKDLLTECEVCTGKYCLRFSYRPSDERAKSVR